MSEWWISTDYLASPHHALLGMWNAVELCLVTVAADRKENATLRGVERRQQTTTALCGCFIPGGDRSLDSRFQDMAGKRTSVWVPLGGSLLSLKGEDVKPGSARLTAEQLNTVAISKSDVWTLERQTTVHAFIHLNNVCTFIYFWSVSGKVWIFLNFCLPLMMLEER